MHFIGLDIHKKTISYCVKDVSGTVLPEGTVAATRAQLDDWLKTLPAPWTVAVKVAHPLMLRAIAAAKKKNDRIDASKICDCLRCDFLPECYMVSAEVRERRRTLRYRKLLVRQNVQLRNKVSQMLMESGVVYNKQKLHKVGYFKEQMETNPDISRELKPLLAICRETIVRIGKTFRIAPGRIIGSSAPSPFPMRAFLYGVAASASSSGSSVVWSGTGSAMRSCDRSLPTHLSRSPAPTSTRVFGLPDESNSSTSASEGSQR
jgi:transposase